MRKEQVKISIVTPTYNSEKYLEDCILSIRNQNYSNYEHIIIDGGSTDQTIDIIKKYEGTYPMKWISEPDKGMYDAIDKGFKMANGDVYAWLNSDDFYFPWAFYVVAKVFRNKKIRWLTGVPSNTKKFGYCDITYQLSNLPAIYCTPLIKRGVYDGKMMYFVQQESCFWTRDLWNEVGGIDKKYKLAGDYFLWKKFAEKTKIYTVHCNLATFRIHENQKSNDKERYINEAQRNDCMKITQIFMQIFLQLYSLLKYNKYMINIDDIMNKGEEYDV